MTESHWLYAVLAVYFVCLALVSLFSVHRYVMLYLFYRRKPKTPPPLPEGFQYPVITVQLPVFNERYVIERLISSVAQLDYPRGRLQIQVLDDSTDDTQTVARQAVADWASKGVWIEYIHRSDRSGYKAGALQHGLETAAGELVAIFDADFIPPRVFLRDIVPWFQDPKTGMVQLRWDHLNRRYSLLTQLQSIMLDGHFVIEHAARHYSDRFFNFNGTAGIWRRSTIEDAGGWQHDTLTEDLDLSYRAQLRGWKFIYSPAITIPAELPVEMNAFKTQQHRWTKGSIQTALKLLPTVWRSKHPLSVKIEATFHLANNFAYLLMMMVALLMLPVILIRQQCHVSIPFWVDLVLFMAATVSIAVFYIASQREILPNWKRQILYVPFMMGLGLGLCVNNAKAVLEALFGVKTGFVRTPKFGVEKRGDSWFSNRYLSKAGSVALVESALAAYYAVIVVHCVVTGNFFTLPFMLLFLFGFGYVGLQSLRSLLRRPSGA